jgi:hypothetical protein
LYAFVPLILFVISVSTDVRFGICAAAQLTVWLPTIIADRSRQSIKERSESRIFWSCLSEETDIYA